MLLDRAPEDKSPKDVAYVETIVEVITPFTLTNQCFDAEQRIFSQIQRLAEIDWDV